MSGTWLVWETSNRVLGSHLASFVQKFSCGKLNVGKASNLLDQSFCSSSSSSSQQSGGQQHFSSCPSLQEPLRQSSQQFLHPQPPQIVKANSSRILTGIVGSSLVITSSQHLGHLSSALYRMTRLRQEPG